MNLLFIHFSHILRIEYYLILHSKDCLKFILLTTYLFIFLKNHSVYTNVFVNNKICKFTFILKCFFTSNIFNVIFE